MKKTFKRNFFVLASLTFQLFEGTTEAAVIYPARHNEWDILDIVAQLIPKNPVVIQGGYDEVTIHRMPWLWPQGKIYIFEANPERFKALANSPHLGYIHAEIFPCALDAVTGHAPFYISPTLFNPCPGSLLPARDTWKWYYTDQTEIQVPCKNLQEWADERSLKAVDFLWLNIGGAELRVLKSSPGLLETVKVILVETHDKEFRSGMGRLEDVKALLDRYDLELIHQWKIPQYQGYSLFMKRGLAEVKR